MQKIDAFPHILPRECYERFRQAASGFGLLFLNGLEPLRALYDLDIRFGMMDQFEDYRQVLTMSCPPIETVARGPAGRDLARMINDSMAELVARYPDRFVGFAASLPMDDPEAAQREIERSVGELGALGVQIFTNVNGHSLDEPRFEPVFATMARLDRPIWVHGARGCERAEFLGDAESKYGLWLSLGWPYEMGLFAARIVCSGLLDRYPNLRILTHHGGGMIPMFSQRVGPMPLGFHGPDHDPERAAFTRLQRPPLDYFKMLYADTTVGGSRIAVETSPAFFGIDHVMFATDMPFGPEGGLAFVRQTIGVIEELELDAAARGQIFASNAERVLGIP